MSSKRTRSQVRILELLKTLDSPISAQDLYVELRSRDLGLGLATVYRALEGLKLQGAVQVRTLSGGESLYSLVKEDRHHLICLQCGDSIPIQECPVHELESQLNESYRFKIYYHMLEFFGLCTRCQIAQAKEGES